jgi:hypothetical protein
MPLAELRAYEQARRERIEEGLQPPDFEDRPDPVGDFLMRVEHLRELLAGFGRDDTPTIYIDPERFPTDFSRERILRQFQASHPGVHFLMREVRSNELEEWAFTRSQNADEEFRHLGFFCSLRREEVTHGDRPTPTHVVRNQAAACLQLRIVANADAAYENRKTYAPPAARQGAAARQAFETMDRFLRALCGETRRAPLVFRQGVFLPSRALRGAAQPGEIADVVYPGSRVPLETAMKLGVDDPFHILPASREEVAAQVRIEYDQSDRFFSGATRPAVVLWQIQALAFLRTATGATEFYASTALSDIIDRSRRLLGNEHDLQEHRRAVVAGAVGIDAIDGLTSPVAAALRDESDRSLDTLRDLRIPVPLDVTCGFGLTPRQYFVAAVHGSTYGPMTILQPASERDIAEACCEDPVRLLNPIGAWLGTLKRRRYHILDRQMAERFRVVVADDEEQGLHAYLGLIEERLGSETWAVLKQACKDLLSGAASGPIEIVYEWTRDLDLPPRSAERVSLDKIRMRGPLLDFPTREVETWNRRAERLWRPQSRSFEFEAPGR